MWNKTQNQSDCGDDFSWFKVERKMPSIEKVKKFSDELIFLSISSTFYENFFQTKFQQMLESSTLKSHQTLRKIKAWAFYVKGCRSFWQPLSKKSCPTHRQIELHNFAVFPFA